LLSNLKKFRGNFSHIFLVKKVAENCSLVSVVFSRIMEKASFELDWVSESFQKRDFVEKNFFYEVIVNWVNEGAGPAELVHDKHLFVIVVFMEFLELGDRISIFTFRCELSKPGYG